jgi:hypothetical protein
MSAEGKGDVTMNDVEQLANLKMRYAYELVRKQGLGEVSEKSTGPEAKKASRDGQELPATPSADTLLADAERLLSQLALFSESGERLALRGGLYKRRAAIAARRRESAAAELDKMADAYRRASEAMRSDGKSDDPYPLTNYIAAELLRAPKFSAKEADAWRREIDEAERTGRRQQDLYRDFWSRSNVADCLLMRALIDGTIAESSDLIVREYREAQNRGASLKEWRSVVENLEFLLDVAPQSSLPQGQLDALGRIYASLESFWLTGQSPPPSAAQPQGLGQKQ